MWIRLSFARLYLPWISNSKKKSEFNILVPLASVETLSKIAVASSDPRQKIVASNG